MELATNYMGLELRNPLVASASPLSHTVDGVRRLADAGVGAVVLHLLFEEQLQEEATVNARLVDAGTESFAESLSYFPSAVEEEPGPRRHLSLVERAAAAVDVPVIASLNCVRPGEWTECAGAMQDAGAGAIELNIYYLPGDPSTPGRDVEQRYVDVLQRVKDAVTVPVAVKLGPYFSSTGEIVLRLDEAGADALVLFNRFLQPSIDPETLTVVPSAALSSPVDAVLPQTWIALLRGRVRSALAGTSGVEDSADVARYLLAGADVVMTASALLRNGPEHATVLLDGLSAWMARKGFQSVDELRGMLSVPARRRRGCIRARGLCHRAAGRKRPLQPCVVSLQVQHDHTNDVGPSSEPALPSPGDFHLAVGGVGQPRRLRRGARAGAAGSRAEAGLRDVVRRLAYVSPRAGQARRTWHALQTLAVQARGGS